MKRFPWDILLALLIGLGLGLAYAWVIAPQRFTASEPSTLRSDFKDQFRSAIAASYAATGNLPRAQARLSLLKENSTEALSAQAQRTIASGQFTQADQLAALALAIENGGNTPPQPTSTVEIFEPVTNNVEPSITPFPSPSDLEFILTETPEIIETQPGITQAVLSTPTPRPTRTPPPTQGPPFLLSSVDNTCDPNLPEGLLQMVVFNSNRRQLSGVEIIVTWDTGEEQFFTGLKPELGNGYADFLMTPDTTYTAQLGLGSEIAVNLLAQTCQASHGESYLGGYKLTFQQP